MRSPPLNVLALAWAVGATAACSQSATNTASSGGANSRAASSPSDDSATSSAAPVDCSKVFAPSDVASVLSGPIKIERDAYPIGCHFVGTGAEVTVDVDPSLEMVWSSVAADTEFVDLPDVGDQARRRASNGYDVVSRKGKHYCGAGYSMQSTATSLSGEELAKRLGALCNKLFAASACPEHPRRSFPPPNLPRPRLDAPCSPPADLTGCRRTARDPAVAQTASRRRA